MWGASSLMWGQVALRDGQVVVPMGQVVLRTGQMVLCIGKLNFFNLTLRVCRILMFPSITPDGKYKNVSIPP